MSEDLVEITLADLVTAAPARAAVLDQLGLDYCCHGERTLGEACAGAGLDVAEVVARLEDQPSGPGDGWQELPPVELAERIVATHHAYLRTEFPEVETLAEKVRQVHGERHPELAAVRGLVGELWGELEPHLDEEEQVLFPAVRALAADPEEGAPQAGTIEQALIEMDAEHDRAGDLLARLRAVTGGFAVPADGCASYRSLYDRLERLELDTHLHVHKENHVLFPAVLALAGRRGAGAPG